MKKAKQNIHGVILLDKPTGMSSNKALQIVKHLFNAQKAGHTGSLDPLATGLLPICFGQATKVTEYLLDGDKRYTTVMKLGETTDTLDSEGEVLQKKLVDVSDNEIEQALVQFRGVIQQVPPMYSALKKDGQPLYKLARKGETIDRPPRTMTVHSLSAERLDENHVRLQVHCSSGFYIRSLVDDLGQVLGCGAHVVELRRIESKGIGLDQTVSLEQLEDSDTRVSALLPIDSLIMSIPKLDISDQQATSLLQGKATSANGVDTAPLLRLYNESGELFAIGEVDQNQCLKTHKIFVLGD